MEIESKYAKYCIAMLNEVNFIKDHFTVFSSKLPAGSQML